MIRFVIVLIFLFSNNLLFGKCVSILQYDLYEPKDKSIADFREAKETTASLLLEQLSIDGFSFTEDTNANKAIRKGEFAKNKAYDYLTLKTPYYTSYLCYRKDKVELKSSKVYETSQYAICVYELSCDGGKPLYLFVYRQSKGINTNRQHLWILDFIEKQGIKERIVLLGSGDEIEKKENIIPKIQGAGVQLISSVDGEGLIADNKFQWTPQLSFAYFSADLLEEDESVDLERADVGYFFSENKGLGLLGAVPFYTYNIFYKEASELIFEYPKVTIISQNKTHLTFTVTWDSEKYIKVETLSIIGNNFHNNIFLYRGQKKLYSIDITDYPTGIYMIRASDESDKMVLRRFTVY